MIETTKTITEYKAIKDEFGNIVENVIISEEVIELAQDEVDALARAFLKETDYKVTRHRDQLDMGIETSLNSEEYAKLLEERQQARNQIVV